ncbi:uncharacterized protein [Trachinotus anak]|uniref:uncharacterized protein n=1 Tax=Trachinotus anak TaxID=443729 RepID=UPI0039F237D1
MFQNNFNASLSVSEVSEESRRLHVSEEVEMFGPRELLQEVHDQEISCCHEHNYKVQSNIWSLEGELKELRAKQRTFKKDQENLYRLLGKLKEINNKLSVTVLNAAKLEAENTILVDLGCETAEIKEDLAQVSYLLSVEQTVRQKNETYISELEEEKLVVSQREKNVTTELTRLESLTEKQRLEIENLRATNYDLEHPGEDAQHDNCDKDQLSQRVVDLEHLIEKLQTEEKNLLATVQNLQESPSDQKHNEKMLKEKNTSLTEEMAHLECVRERNQGEIESLRAAVRDLRRQVEDAQQLILNKDELIEKQNREMSHKQEMMKEYYKLKTSMQQLLLDSRTCHEHNAKLRSMVRALEEDLKEVRAKDSNYTKQQEELHKLHSQLEELNSELGVKILEATEVKTENTKLQESVCNNQDIKEELAWVSDLLSVEQTVRQKNETYICELEEENLVVSQKEKNVTTELTRLESLTEKQRIESKNLRAANCDLEHPGEEAQHDNCDKDQLSQRVVDLEHLIEKLQTEEKNLLATVQNLQESLSDQKKINAEFVLLESQTEEKQAENENLWVEIHALQHNEKMLKEKNTSLTEEMAHLECVRERNQGEIESLRAAVRDLRRQVEDAQQLILNKDELIEKQNREMSHKQGIIEEYYKLKTSMQQLLLDSRTCHEHNAKLRSMVRALEEDLKEVRAKDSNYTKQQEELHKLHSQLEELNSELGVKILQVTELTTENTKLQESVCNNQDIKEELAWVSDLLSQEQKVRQKNDIYIKQLEEENLVVNEKKKNMIVELTRLESLTEKQRIENENLWLEIHALRKNEKMLKDKNASLTAELTHLEIINQGEIESLRAAVSDLQCQLEDAQQVILKQEQQSTQKNREISHRQQLTEEQRHENLQETPAAEPQQLEALAAAMNLEQPGEEAQHDNCDKDQLSQRVVDLEHLIEKLQTEEKNLLATVQNLQESLSDQKKINAEFVLLESQTEEKQAENENLWVEIHALQHNEKMLNENIKSLTDEVAKLECVRERNQGEIESLRAAVRDFQCQVKEAQEVHRDKDEVTQKLTHVESLMEKKHTEVEKLRTALHSLQEKEEFLNEQNNMVTAELARLESLREKQNEENNKLKTAVQDLQYQVKEAQQLLFTKDELIAKQNNEIAYKQQVVEEYYTLTSNLRQSLCDVKSQLGMKQEEDILAGIKNFTEESRTFVENGEKLEMHEEQKDESLKELLTTQSQQLETPAAEPQQLETHSAEPQQLETPAAEPQQLETHSAEPQQLETPAAEPQWRRCAKRLLNVGLNIGITTVGMLIPAVILTASCSTNPSCYDCAYRLLEPYCDVQQGQHPF